MTARRMLRAIASFMRRIFASHSASIAKPRRLGDKAAAAAQNRTVCGMAGWTLGVIGGSGLYEIEGLQDAAWRRIESPFGQPSDELLTGRLGAGQLFSLPRHGRGHRLPPTAVNSRANIDALKRAGCTDVISLSAVGSLREALSPGTFVIVDQYIDRSFAREKSFFGDGLVAHVSIADPVCPRLAGFAAEAAREAGAPTVEGGTYLCME